MNTITKPFLVALAAATMTLSIGCDNPEDPTVEDRTIDVDVVVDGVRYEPDQMEQFEGDALHYVLDAQAQADGVIYAFHSLDDRASFVTEREPAILAQESQELTFRAPLTFSKFYDWVDYDELFGKLKKGQSISSLANHPDYNDNDISSVKCRVGAYTYLYDFAAFGGGSLLCRAINVEDLGLYGWNARASSLEVTP